MYFFGLTIPMISVGAFMCGSIYMYRGPRIYEEDLKKKYGVEVKMSIDIKVD